MAELDVEQPHRKYSNNKLLSLQRQSTIERNTDEENDCLMKNKCLKELMFWALVIVTIIQYSSSSYSCFYSSQEENKKRSHSPETIITIAIVHVGISTLILFAACKKRCCVNMAWCSNTALLVKGTTTCMLLLFLIYLGMIGYVEAHTIEQCKCEVYKILLKVQAILTVFQGTLFVLVANA